MSQHAGLTAERWAAFSPPQRLLMIGNEMNRAGRFHTPEGLPHRRLGYERVLRLVDLTVEVDGRPTLRRELLRWRDLVAEMYLSTQPEPSRHREVFRALLLLHPDSATQIPHVLG
jgi:hypothetical protein